MLLSSPAIPTPTRPVGRAGAATSTFTIGPSGFVIVTVPPVEVSCVMPPPGELAPFPGDVGPSAGFPPAA